MRIPPRSPNLNVHLEQSLRSLKDECLDRMGFFGEKSLRKAAGQFLVHYHQEMNHQGLGNRLIEMGGEVSQTTTGEVQCRDHLMGRSPRGPTGFASASPGRIGPRGSCGFAERTSGAWVAPGRHPLCYTPPAPIESTEKRRSRGGPG